MPKNLEGKIALITRLKYESKEIVPEKDFVIVRRRFLGLGQPTDRIAADIFPSRLAVELSIGT